MMRNNFHKSAGFTLIEILVATAILAFLSIYTAQSIQSAIKSKVKIEKEIAATSQVRDALSVIERDIHLAFNYRDFNIELYNLAGKNRQAQSNQNQNPSQPPPGQSSPNPGGTPGQATPPPTPAQPFEPKQQKIYTQFLGGENELTFTSLNHPRTTSDSKTSDQMVVGYSLKDCSERLNPSAKSRCLWRRVNPIITSDITRGGVDSVLLENVTKFELRYIGPGKVFEKAENWPKQWYTNEKGDEITKGKFPYAVEVTLEAHNKNVTGQKPVRMTVVAELRFPNNPVDTGGPSNAQTPGIQPSTGSSNPTTRSPFRQ